jgi:hypothetical protein
VEGAAKKLEPHEKDLPTAYVQDMLTTDPVHELGLRVTRISSSTLEFVSLSEAKTELSASRTMSVRSDFQLRRINHQELNKNSTSLCCPVLACKYTPGGILCHTIFELKN